MKKYNKIENDFNRCINYLCGLKTNPLIAFVVTASDRLENEKDLKGEKAEEFKAFATRIENTLNNKKCKWYKII